MFAFILRCFLHDVVLSIACLLALCSFAFVPLQSAAVYAGYVNAEVLSILFCLMAVVAGLMQSGLFARASQALLQRCSELRWLTAVLVGMSFFSSMLITNDVALIALVPLTIALLAGLVSQRRLVLILVLETVAANLGSMLTPVGNPQNLFIYSHYQLSLGDFMLMVAPACAVGLALLLLAVALCRPRKLADLDNSVSPAPLNLRALGFYGALFTLCLLCVLRLVEYQWCLALTLGAILVFDWRILKRVDYTLLGSFIAFFVLVGNLAHLPFLQVWMHASLAGQEFSAAILLSQIISNVPATVMLSQFTENVHALLLGVNVGGLGTLIASFASLITYRYYCRSEGAKPLLFLGLFSMVNVLMLFCLGGVVSYLFV